MDQRRVILTTAKDLIRHFLYHDRKEDTELAPGEIESAIQQGVVTVDEILTVFHEALASGIKRP